MKTTRAMNWFEGFEWCLRCMHSIGGPVRCRGKRNCSFPEVEAMCLSRLSSSGFTSRDHSSQFIVGQPKQNITKKDRKNLLMGFGVLSPHHLTTKKDH
jgi:hypothetical protein